VKAARGAPGPGSDGAFEGVFRAHYAAVVAFAWHMTGDRACGEDIAQEVFVALLRSGLSAELRAPLAWLRTATYRRALNELRHTGRGQRAVGRLPAVAPPSDDVDGDLDPRLVSALRSLSINQRAAALLVYGDDVGVAEAARLLGCTPATVRVHLWRARAALREALEPADEASHLRQPDEEPAR